MMPKNQQNKKHEATAVWPIFVCLALIVGFMMIFDDADASLFGNKKAQTQIFAALSGFEPGAQVTYSMSDKDGRPVRASQTIDQNGYLNIPMPQDLAVGPADLVYDISITETGQTRALVVRFNPQSRKLSINGQSDSPFADIEIQAAGSNIETRSDWAGLFEATGIQLGNDKKETAPVQVAFFSSNIASDADEYTSPSIAKVVIAFGGGGPTSAGVNQWAPVPCGQYPISTCDTARVDQQIANFVDKFVLPLQLMTEQLSALAAQQMLAVGSFFDAKNQLEVQREHQRLKAQAIKDYHPSEQMCRVGSYVRSLSNAEEKARFDQLALNELLLDTQLNNIGNSAVLGSETYNKDRLRQFITTYCDPNNSGEGLKTMCAHGNGVGAADLRRVNKDIDFTRTVEFPYTLEVNFADASETTEDEQDVVALARNLYWANAFDFVDENKLKDKQQAYMRIRSFIALNNLAHNSYTKLVSMKAEAPDPAPGSPVQPGWSYMKTLLQDLVGGDNPAEVRQNIADMVGENPSYYAQMDILTKKIFQDPDFYTNLYDKPVNIERIHTALDAIRLMQLRDHYEASLRREMLLSGVVQEELTTDAEKLNGLLLR